MNSPFYNNTPRKTRNKKSNNTFEKYIEKMPSFLDRVISVSPLPYYIVPVEKKGCKLLRSSRLTQKEIREKVRYLQFFQNNEINLTGVHVAVIDDATKYTSMLYKYREYFESKGAIVKTYSFVGQEKLKTAEREQYDTKATIFQYLEESTYQEYIIQQSQILSSDENFFDIDHFVVNIRITPRRYEMLLSALNSIGDIEFTNDVYTPLNIEKISLFNFNIPTAESVFPNGITKGVLQKIRFAYNKDTHALTLAPMSFPVWNSSITSNETLFKNIPFVLPYKQNDSISDEALFFNICYAFHLYLLKGIFCNFLQFSEFLNFKIETRDLNAYIGSECATLVVNSAKDFLLSEELIKNDIPERMAINIPQEGITPFESIYEIMDELRSKYDKLVNQSNSLLDVRYFLSYEEIIKRYIGRANLMKWIDILCDRGVLVARNCEKHGVFYRACRSGEGDYDHIEKKSYALVPIAINACGKLHKLDNEGEFFRINSLYLNKVLTNLVYDYPSDDYDFHALFTKPHHFGPLTYLKDQLEDEKDIPIYDADKISKFCTYDEKKKEFVSPNLKRIKQSKPEYFGQSNAVPYTEIAAYLGYLKHIRNIAGTDDFLNAMVICRDEDIYSRHINHNLKTSYRDIINATNCLVDNRKEKFLRDSARNINSAKTKLKYVQSDIVELLKNSISDEIVFDMAQERIVKSIIPFSNNFITQKKTVMEKVATIEYLITNLMLFDTTQDKKFLKQFIREYNKQKYVSIENIEYYSVAINEDRSKWDDNTFLHSKNQIEVTKKDLIEKLQENIKLLPDTRDENLQKKKRQNMIYAINKSARYLSNNHLNSISVLYYNFTGNRNLENKKNINVTDTVQENVAKILVQEMNAKIIFGATGADEYGIIIFDSISTALDFAKELTSVFSSKISSHNILSQISFCFGCACRFISENNKDEQIEEALKDAQRCATVELSSSSKNRFIVSSETQQQQQLPITTDFTEIKLLNQTYFKYKSMDYENEEVINCQTHEYKDELIKIGIITALLDEHTAMKQMMTPCFQSQTR